MYVLTVQIFRIIILFNDIQRHSSLAQCLNQHNPVISGKSSPDYIIVNDEGTAGTVSDKGTAPSGTGAVCNRHERKSAKT